MDHIPVGEIASDALGNRPMSVTPRAYGNANATALLMAAFTEADRRSRALGYSHPWRPVRTAVKTLDSFKPTTLRPPYPQRS
jgi:hypothetical protein